MYPIDFVEAHKKLLKGVKKEVGHGRVPSPRERRERFVQTDVKSNAWDHLLIELIPFLI